MSQHLDVRAAEPTREDSRAREPDPLVVPVPVRVRRDGAELNGLREVLRVARRNWLVVVAAVVVALVAGWAVTASTPSTYQTETKVLITPSITPEAASSGSGVVTQAAALVTSQIPTYAALTTTPFVLDPAIESSGVSVASTQLDDDVTAQVVPDTSIISITVTSGSGRDAAELANAVAASLIAQVGVQNTPDSPVQISGRVVQAPEIPTTPASPSLLLNLAVAFAVGLLVAFLLVVVRQALAAGTRAA